MLFKVTFLYLFLFSTMASYFGIESMNIDETLEIRKTYDSDKEELAKLREKMAKLLKTGREKEEVILAKSKVILEDFLVTKTFPAWHYTPWNFNGTASDPGKGKIACGYFVAAALIDLGFKVDRKKLSQRPSSLIVRTFSSKKYIYREIGTSYLDYFVNLEEKLADGIYIVGLDNHTGFIQIKDGKRIFIHSNPYVHARYVISQDIDESFTHLQFSSWKEVGQLFTKPMIKRWLEGKEFKVRMSK